MKHNNGNPLPFDPKDWDVDAFIVSDDIAKNFKKKGFRDGREINEIETITKDLELQFKNIEGYRIESNKPFTFRIWTNTEFEEIVKPNGYKLLE